jgi:hypothetical protein
MKGLFRESWTWLLVLSWLFLPWFAALLLHSTFYDTWRHLFFIYPAFILVAVAGLKSLLKEGNNIVRRSICVTLILVQSAFLLQFMIANHPYENVYFNVLAGKHPQKKFDLDYWGLSYRQGLDYLVNHAKEDTIKVHWQNIPCSYNLIWLNEEQRKRIKEMSLDSCDYFLTNFRDNPEQYTDSAWHTIRVNNFSILAIEKLR